MVFSKMFLWGIALGSVFSSSCLATPAWAQNNSSAQGNAPSQHNPLYASSPGAHYDGKGTEFTVFSRFASSVEICLFDQMGHETACYPMRGSDAGYWNIYLEEVGPGQLYGYRATGEFSPQNGLYYNPHKLLLDPYARQVQGDYIYTDALFSYQRPLEQGKATLENLKINNTDSAPYVMKAVVTDNQAPQTASAPRPHTPWQDSVIYETHVKGFSKLNQALPAELRGTYAGLGSPESISYLKDLGVTAVELLPVYLSLSEGHLFEHKLRNYWGYNPVSFFIPNPNLAASQDSVSEFRTMVDNLHRAGLEVILDVVYNHSAEGGWGGPTISMRGLDNLEYYKHDLKQAGNYIDYTGCGNSLDLSQDATLKMVLDSLDYWVKEMHVDGFRFDLASTLARTAKNHAYDPQSPFFKALEERLHNDPDYQDIKLIAEPWDCREGGYQLGNYPAPWSEWNDEWRDTLRRFWRGDRGQVAAVAEKMAGTPHKYAQRSPWASINFYTCHDGFTLHDMFSYNRKDNFANAEDNRDGRDDNISWNCGQEGPSTDEAINALRQRQARNVIMSLAFSQGVPMLLGGDEIGRTQQGNNNAYCQDNAISWYDWNLKPEQQELHDFTKRALQLRQSIPALQAAECSQAQYFNRQGQSLSVKDLTCIGENALTISYSSAQGPHYLLLMNSESHSLDFTLPKGQSWQVKLSSQKDCPQVKRNGHLKLEGYSCCLVGSK